ncbi:extracellular medium-chain-length polyhydroxyalkanoate depolymerase [Leptospira neocaledonica]|uniref:Plasmid partitioning protein n=1 Tax=Leptospira neocaledonica TaxID=2023192 RepID=A0A2N0A0B8_9LEPT|nr:plasmid partitioning protein [Leptospira neocaledonica]PJZ77736.1 plasmid partitioning protein [Leptospira neocaledonica]
MLKRITMLMPLLIGALLFAGAGEVDAARCKTTGLLIKTTSCSYSTKKIEARPGIFRDVRYQVPEGTAPAGGWPVVVMYQGSFFTVQFSRTQGEPFGGYYEVKVIEKMLDNGFAVIAPDAGLDLFWETNLPTIYELTADYIFLNNLFAAIRNGSFGPINANKKFATGISSGGYNTSRMAVSFPGEFKALAIQSGSYATCSGPICIVPTLPSNHPPTFFMHGFLDAVVPWWTMDLYYDKLRSQGIPTDRYTDYLAGHEWVSASAGKIYSWFNQYR